MPVDLDELERLEREATPTDETRALVDESDKSGLVYVTIECDEWRCRLTLRTREWMRMYPYVAAQALCDVLMKELAPVLFREDTDCVAREIERLRTNARLGARVREVMEANGTNPERFVSEWCRAQAEYETEEAAREWRSAQEGGSDG